MRVSLDLSAITGGDANRGIGVYAGQLQKRLPRLVNVVPINQQPDLIHSLVFKLFSKQSLPLVKNIPTVVTVHDLIPLKFPRAYPPGIKGKLTWFKQKRALSQAAAIITDSLASKQDIIRFTGIISEKIQVVYLAADPIFKPIKAVNKWNLPNKFVLYVGDLNWNKNVVELAKTCLELNYPLVVVGRQAVETDYDHNHPETVDLVEFQRLAKLYPDKIKRLGVVSAKDLAAVYSLATVYAQPSRYEGFGLPVLEAMACGCPVLSSEAGSLPEITGKATLLFNGGNLKRVWTNPALRTKLKQLGLKQAKNFSWEKTVRETVKVYEKII